MNENNLNTKRAIDVFVWMLTVIAGTVCSLAGAIAVSIGNMWMPEEGERFSIYYSETDEFGNFTDRTVDAIFNGQDFTLNEEGVNLSTSEIVDRISHWMVLFKSEHQQADLVEFYAIIAIIAAIVFLAGLTVACVLTGRFRHEHDGRIYLNWFDRLWSEVQLVLLAGAVGGAVALAIPIVTLVPYTNRIGFTPLISNEYVFFMRNETVAGLCAAGIAVLILLSLTIGVSLVKKIKAHSFWKKSLTGKFFAAIGRGLSSVAHAVRTSDRFMLKYVGAFILMMLLAMTWVGAIIDLVVIFVYVPKVVNRYREIHKGVSEVKAGNLTYKIPYETDSKGPKSDLDSLASDINEISQAANLAVQNELKNQRMKTDLISNVSHDLKTPLTSMISYVDLLKTEGLDSENAPEYLNVIDEKTQRLKILTENLFEAAKASSGNIPCEIADIDITEIVNQAIGEMSDRLEGRKLDIIVKNDLSDSTVRADGKLLWRVIENLLSNVSKYSLEGSRVYINLSDVSSNRQMGTGMTLLEVKNISKDALNIPADELMERFKRGDESRNTEGSGLGLAIAKDLTTLMGGIFEITVDGDLFKASVMLDKTK